MQKISLCLTAVLLACLFYLNAAHVQCSAENYTCPPSAPCCSIYGYCGRTHEYCAPSYCQKGCPKASARNGGLLDEADKPINYNRLRSMISRGVYSYCKDPTHAAITLDDGISRNTAKALDVFAERKVKASFFIIGKNIAKYLDFDQVLPNENQKENHEIFLRIVKEGHVVGSHSFSHLDLTELTSNEVNFELETTDKLFKDLIGVRPRFLRVPEGYHNFYYIALHFLFRKVSNRLLDRLKSNDYIVLHWSYDSEDWRTRDHRISEHLANTILPAGSEGGGPIILLHDFIDATITALPKVITDLQEKGYKLVDMYECLGVEPYRF